MKNFDENRLVYEMKKAGISKNGMCKKTGISRSAFYRKCKGLTQFKQQEIHRISDELGLSIPNDIFFPQNRKEQTMKPIEEEPDSRLEIHPTKESAKQTSRERIDSLHDNTAAGTEERSKNEHRIRRRSASQFLEQNGRRLLGIDC